jgi:hypothetical protein
MIKDEQNAQPDDVRCPLDICPDALAKPTEDDAQGNLYEFYLLLQRLKAGGISFDTFIERATTWAKLRAAHNRQY